MTLLSDGLTINIYDANKDFTHDYYMTYIKTTDPNTV